MDAPRNEISSGGLLYDAVWIRASLAASYRPGEVLVRLGLDNQPEPLAFFVDESLVEPAPLSNEEPVEGRVKVMLLERRNGEIVVEVPGEPVSFGPKVILPATYITE